MGTPFYAMLQHYTLINVLFQSSQFVFFYTLRNGTMELNDRNLRATKGKSDNYCDDQNHYLPWKTKSIFQNGSSVFRRRCGRLQRAFLFSLYITFVQVELCAQSYLSSYCLFLVHSH